MKTMTLTLRGNLWPWEYEGLRAYFQRVIEKVEAGRAEYGVDYLDKADPTFLREIQDELADLCGWSAMRFIRLMRLMEVRDGARLL